MIAAGFVCAGLFRAERASRTDWEVVDAFSRHGTIWNLSMGGVYAVLRGPLPPVLRTVLLTFALPGDSMPVTCVARVQWHNPPAGLEGRGSARLTLPAGCGLAFQVLSRQDAARISARVLPAARKVLSPDDSV